MTFVELAVAQTPGGSPSVSSPHCQLGNLRRLTLARRYAAHEGAPWVPGIDPSEP